MGMNKKAIETFSVNAVRDSIMMSKFLDQYIPDNDKEPFWDGAVYVYKNESHKKENFKGRVPVQVKGKECKDLSKSEITYPVSTTDLKGYLKEGGTIFFVVYIANNGLIKKIYYIELTPIRIMMILEEAKTHKTKNIKFKEFPTDNNQKATIFLNCLQNCQKQSSFSNAKLFSIEELQAQGVLEGLIIPLAGVKIDEDPQRALISNDVYLYANIKGSSVLQPVKLLPGEMQTVQEVDTDITIEGKKYYSKIKIVKNAKATKYVIGESLTITTADGEITKVNYVSSDNLSILVKDLEFILDYINYGYFESNGIRFPFDSESADFSKFNCEDQKAILSFAQRTTQMLNTLGCKKPLLLNSLSEVDMRNIERLNIAFVDNGEVSGLKEKLPPVCNMNIGNLNFALAFYKGSAKGKYRIENFFKTEMLATYKNANDLTFPISQFALLKVQDFLKLDNLDCRVFLPSFKKIEKHEETFVRANFFLLDMLSAYDESGNNDFLITAKSFAEWIMTSTDDELPCDVKVLNLLQIHKRMRDLTDSEIKTLYEMVENPDSQEAILVGAYLLLGQQIPAKIHFDKLPTEIQEEFKTYPIYNKYWQNSEDEDNG